MSSICSTSSSVNEPEPIEPLFIRSNSSHYNPLPVPRPTHPTTGILSLVALFNLIPTSTSHIIQNSPSNHARQIPIKFDTALPSRPPDDTRLTRIGRSLPRPLHGSIRLPAQPPHLVNTADAHVFPPLTPFFPASSLARRSGKASHPLQRPPPPLRAASIQPASPPARPSIHSPQPPPAAPHIRPAGPRAHLVVPLSRTTGAPGGWGAGICVCGNRLARGRARSGGRAWGSDGAGGDIRASSSSETDAARNTTYECRCEAGGQGVWRGGWGGAKSGAGGVAGLGSARRGGSGSHERGEGTKKERRRGDF